MVGEALSTEIDPRIIDIAVQHLRLGNKWLNHMQADVGA
jgi:hypothetical protein